MSLVLDGRTAFSFWMSASGTVNTTRLSAGNNQLTSFEGVSRRDLSSAIARKDGVQQPLYLLVKNPEERRCCGPIVCSSWSKSRPIPDNSIITIGDNLRTVSPELCLLRLAVQLPRLDFLRALTDMLGIYFLSMSNRTNLISREPITTKASIEEFLARVPGAPGSSLLKRALNWTVERSASPRETTMDLDLILPTKLGGQGLPPFEANYKYELTNDARPLTLRHWLVADVAWPKRNETIEYNSSKFHDDEAQKEFDFEKITAMQRMGKTVTPISNRQFSNYESFESIVVGLRKRWGMRDRFSTEVAQRRADTHGKLLAMERAQRTAPPLLDTAIWQFLLPRLDVSTPAI